jgi:outer membrane protein TolC
MIQLFFPLLALASAENFFQDLDSFRAKSLNLKTELKRVESSSARAWNRSLHWTPDISLGASRSKTTARSGDDKGVSYAESWRASANLNLFRGGSDFLNAQAANLQEDAQKLQYEAEILSLENRVGKLLFQSLSLRDSLSAQKSLLKLKEDSFRIGKERYSQGKIPSQELTKIELDLSQQRNRLRQAELELEGNNVAMRSLFVENTKTSDWPFSSQVKIFQEPSDSPALKSLQLRAASAHKSYLSAKMQHLPTLDLNFAYQESPIRKRESREWVGSIEFSFPIWNKYSTSANIADVGASAVESENSALAKEKEESLQKDLLKRRIDAFIKNMEENRNNLEKSEKLYSDMLRSFQLGRISVNDLFIEQNRRIDSILSYTESRMAFHESILDACSIWGKRVRDCIISLK